MEKVENIAKYQPQLSKYKKLQLTLKKYIFLIPVLAVVGGIVVAAKLAGAAGVFQPDWSVQFKDMVSSDKEKEDKHSGDKLKAIQDKMKEKIYEDPTTTIVSGSEIVAVDFGKPVITPTQSQPAQVPVVSSDSLPSTSFPSSSAPMGMDTTRTLSGDSQASSSSASTSLEESEPHTPVKQSLAPRKTRRAPVSKKTNRLVSNRKDTTVTLAQAPSVSAFNLIRVKDSNEKKYISCYVNGNQDLITGAFVKLRLGEDTEINGRTFPRNTVFNGVVKVNKNVINISIERIGTENVSFEVFDRDYSPGIVMSVSKNRDVEQTMNEGLYDGANDYGQMLPIQAVQSVARAVTSKKRQKDAIISINDGYLVYISKLEKQ